MTTEGLLVAALGLTFASGWVCLLPGSATLRHHTTVIVLTLGCLFGLTAAGLALAGSAGTPLRWTWSLLGTESVLSLDALSAVFLIPIFAIAGLGAWYGLEYMPLANQSARGSRLQVFYGVTVASMALVVSARDAVLLIVGWEGMALSAFFLVTTDETEAAVREAGWTYLVAAHVSTLLLFAWAGVLVGSTGSFQLNPLAPGFPPALASWIFLLALGGFGIKAGIFPLHVWLPPAHSSAPSHVSALMSGVMIKLGVYGVLRTLWMLPVAPLWWGGLLLTIGMGTGILGIVFAVGQSDMKRLLAYCSIENIGVIFLGISLVAAGKALGNPLWIAVGLAATLLHTWNHGLFKTLLFFGAGSVIHHAGSREIDRLGGLAKTMPRTALFFLAGSVAICGLPPLNGYVSELLVYVGLFKGLSSADSHRWLFSAAGIAALALIGSLSLACFVKLYSALFLGVPRTDAAAHAHDGGPLMTVPMALLVAASIFIGLFPWVVIPVLQPVIVAWSPERAVPGVGDLVPWGLLSAIGIGALGAILAIFWLVRPAKVAATVGTWDCGFVRGSPRIQYTGSSFSQLLVSLWRRVLLPTSISRIDPGAFPATAEFRGQISDPVLTRMLIPFFKNLAERCARLRFLQQGQVQVYLVYIASVFLLGIACAALSPWNPG